MSDKADKSLPGVKRVNYWCFRGAARTFQFRLNNSTRMIEENIFRGPVVEPKNPQESFGQVFYKYLKNHRHPEEIILIDSENGEGISYGKILKLSTVLAENLIKYGVEKGDTISIISQNNYKFLLVVIAGFYIGAKVFLLNPDYTTGELEHMLSKCPPKIIFCSQKPLTNILNLKQKSSCCGDDIFYFDRPNDQVKNFDDLLQDCDSVKNFEPTKLNPEEDVALILTSSGTTGLPKAVLITHKGIKTAHLYASDPMYLDMNENESTIAYLPMFHIFGLIVSLMGILCGTRTIILGKFVPETFLGLVQDFKITKLFGVPSILLFLVKSPLVKNYDLSSITDVLGGAAFIPKDLEDMVKKQFNIDSVRQIYGMTEVTGAITVCPKRSKKPGSCGKATHNVAIKIRDCHSDGRTLKPLEVGEICVKSDGIMKGYCGNVEETESAFDEENFLKTGDLGYCDEEGFVFIVDRLKDIIKYKGFQVAPAELESILIKHAAVKDVGVVGKPDERAGELPVAFIVTQPESTNVGEEELVKYVAENVSVQKRLYGGVKFVNEIPKNASGKILRKQLRELLT